MLNSSMKASKLIGEEHDEKFEEKSPEDQIKLPKLTTNLEYMSNQKLCFFTFGLLIAWTTCIFIGALVSPRQLSSLHLIATKCVDKEADLTSNKWFYPRGEGSCNRIYDFDYDSELIQDLGLTADNFVFVFQMPFMKEKKEMCFTPWQQFLMGEMMLDIKYEPQMITQEPQLEMIIEGRLGYRDKGDPADSWKELDRGAIHKNLECMLDGEFKKEGSFYNCTALTLFKLAPLDHGHNLLNLHLPATYDITSHGGAVGIQANNIGKLIDVHLFLTHQNGGFTLVWLGLKTFFFITLLIEVIWFWLDLRKMPRRPSTLERSLLSLGVSLAALNAPIGYLSIHISDLATLVDVLSMILQSIFYATAMIFWLILLKSYEFKVTNLSKYWKELIAVSIGCLCIFALDLTEYVLQFKSVWIPENLEVTAKAFAFTEGVLAVAYLTYICFKTFKMLKILRQEYLCISGTNRQLETRIIWRKMFLIGITIATTAVTCIGIIFGISKESKLKWNGGTEMEVPTWIIYGMYGLWNCYVFGMIILLAPSSKF